MKRLVARKDPLDVAAVFPLADLVPGWYFRTREVSAGQFVADGTDLYGRIVSHQGGDSRQALEACIAAANGIRASEDTSAGVS